MQLQISGQLSQIEARNGGWFAVSILEPNSQYPKKLSTKKPDLVAQAQSLIGYNVDAVFNESESSNINPNSGLPYMNRYLEAIAMAGQMPQPQPQQFVQQQPSTSAAPVQQVPIMQQPVQPMPVQQMAQVGMQVQGEQNREAKIHRQTASKVAAIVLAFMPPEDQTLSSLIRISEQLVQYYDNGVQWQTAPIQQQPVGAPPNPVQQPQPYPTADPQQQTPDDFDDIPF